MAKDQLLITSDNAKIFYDDEGAGPPIVFVHGYGSDANYWHFQTSYLVARGYRVISLDQRLHGRSDKPQFGQRMSRLGLDLHELIISLDLKDVILVGHSMGANTCLAMFSLFGTDGVSKFVSVDQSPRLVNDNSWGWGIKNVYWESVWDQANFVRPFGEGRDPPRPARVKELFGDGEDAFDGFDHTVATALLLNHLVCDWRDVLPFVNIPVWVVTGRKTPYYHYEGMEWMAAQFPQATITSFEHSGHEPAWYEPEAFNEALMLFIQGRE
ncbi:alpha/beta hydrolase [Rhizobium leguminosarum bv. trifolii]|uniref:alpha/beta fold hydrolase n=1 Tax=Rhizobium leguminosarum TaxID=384 RepID=UPI000E2E4E46|nr:alpha/beta hydrolase [Rhizobium leguminosarum]RFB87074.1 alpha/beta hydrolase [Rhizobium leguminosarum bv. trifolii]